jgi:hypothetical protein
VTPTPKRSSRSRFSLNYLNYSDHTHRIARLNLDHENNIPWAELINERWSTWTAEQLRGKWAALKAKAKVDRGATHRGKYKVYLSAGTLLMIT